MKRYLKNSEVHYANEIIVVANGKQVINPTEEQIVADGWVEFTDKVPTEDELLDRALQDKLAEIDTYDESQAVNEFHFDGISMWLTEEERSVAEKRFRKDLERGKEITSLFHDDHEFILPPQVGLDMLEVLNDYADESFDNTKRHRIQVIELRNRKGVTVEEINAFDVTSDYPQKPDFDSRQV